MISRIKLKVFSLSILFIICAKHSNLYANNDVINAIVNIEFNKVTPWDDGYNTSGVGTGFVIDSHKGLILTNKHILNVGPVIAYGEFANKQKLQLTPIYRDPVHDYGIFQYSPEELNALKIKPIPLKPVANVGDEISLYGNDGGEALSIIQGVLSRLDRTAPNYNSTTTDYNTFYMQAALGTSGGSSGSPILNKDGHAIAINAGARNDTAAAFFLPMDMMLPVLDKILTGKNVQRGTLQTVFEYTPFNQLTEFGWNEEDIEQLNSEKPLSKGVLRITHIVKGSPADGVLQIGDILYMGENNHLLDFLSLETFLNEKVNQTVDFVVLRKKEKKQLTLSVSNLFELVPDEFIEIGRAIFIPIGLSTARLFNVPASGVLLTAPGRLFGGQGINNYARIEEINGKNIDSLNDFKHAFKNIPTNSKFSLRYRYVYNQKDQEYKKVRNLTPFFVNRHCQDDLGALLWHCKDLVLSNKTASLVTLAHGEEVKSPLVELEVFRPVEVNINREVIRKGNGVVVDIKNGLILTNKDIIDSSLSQVNALFDNGNSTSASVEAIHPYLNMVLIKADLSQIQFKKGLIPQVTREVLTSKENVNLRGRTAHVDFETNVSIEWPIVYYGKTNFDSRDVSYIPDEFSVYTDENNTLLAVAPGYDENNGVLGIIPSELIGAFIDDYLQSRKSIFELKDKLTYLSYAGAIELGLPTEHQLPIGRKLYVEKAEELEMSGLSSGDIILDTALSSNSLNSLYLLLNKKREAFSVLRNGEVIQVPIKLSDSPYLNISDVIVWGGAVIHEIQTHITTPSGTREKCIRVGFRYFGAPVYTALNVDPVCILSIDQQPINSILEVKAALVGKRSGDYTSVEAIRLDKNFQYSEYQVREENYYWPSLHYIRNGTAWKFTRITK